MRAIIRIECAPQGSWGSNGSLDQDSRALTWHVLRKLTEALPSYVTWTVIVGCEDTELEAKALLQEDWIARN